MLDASFNFVGILNCGFSEVVSRTSLNNGICKSQEMVDLPSLQASQDSVDSNMATTAIDSAGEKESIGTESGGRHLIQ